MMARYLKRCDPRRAMAMHEIDQFKSEHGNTPPRLVSVNDPYRPHNRQPLVCSPDKLPSVRRIRPGKVL